MGKYHLKFSNGLSRIEGVTTIDPDLKLRFENQMRETNFIQQGDEPYLISLCTVWVLQWVQNFFSSRRAVVLRRFLVVA
jgi:hypothetical protein